jgi:hypothetical protein
MQNLKAYILCRFAENSSIYNTWVDTAPIPCEVVKTFPPNWSVPDDAGIIVTHMHYRWEEIHALRKVYQEHQIPILILADGILEYRNIWQHPDLADGCVFQPIVGHKLACIGQGQVQVVESWGNLGKCESVGLPRLDSLSEQSAPPVSTEGTFRVLVATANTPAFNDEQRQSVIDSLTHIQKRLSQNSKVNGRPVEVTWRLTDGLDRDLGLEELTDEDRVPLSIAIDHSDAVITTPSTLYLESVLKQRPTAILDFHNTPHYVNSAWMINAPKHFNEIIRELADPPASKMLFQETLLHRELRCDGKATERLCQLISTMVEEGAAARRDNHKIKLPHRILHDQKKGFPVVPAGYNLSEQYPDNKVFQVQELEQLQLELNLAISRLDELPNEINDKCDLFDEMKAIRDDLLVRLDESVAQNQVIMDMNVQIRDRNQGLLGRVKFLMERVAEQRERIAILLERLGKPVPPSKNVTPQTRQQNQNDENAPADPEPPLTDKS